MSPDRINAMGVMALTAQTFSTVDLLRFKFVSDPQLCPSGKTLAFVQTSIEREHNRYRSGIYIMSADGGKPAPFTRGRHRDGSPRWSPCGKYLAFLSDRHGDAGTGGGAQQIYTMSTRGGEARRITDVEGGVLDYQWSPDGSQVSFSARVKGPEAGDTVEIGEGARRLYDRFNEDVKHIRRIFYRLDGRGYLGEKRTQVFILNLADIPREAPQGFAEPQPLTKGDFDHHGAAWSPDGTRIAVAACREENPDVQTFRDVWIFAVRGGEPLRLTGSLGPVDSLSWSPDGSRIAYLGHAWERADYSNVKLWIVPADGSAKPRCITAGFDRSLGNQAISDMSIEGPAPRPAWSPGGDRIYVSASDQGNTHLYSVQLESGRVEQLTEGDHVIHGYDLDPGCSRAVLLRATADNPGDLHIADVDGERPLRMRRLTAANEPLLSSRKIAWLERYTFRAEHGPEVQGWVLRPINCTDGRYPAVLQIHGGPMAMYASCFFFEFQLLAARGIGVIFTNPRGSQGYGENFCAAIESEWGKEDYADVMAGVDGALERFSWIDPQRLGVAGGSYGGFMTSWLIGHTDRFRAAVSMRAVNNMYSMFGTSDMGFFEDETWGEGKPPWDQPHRYLRQSPITYVGKATTPTLILHSEEDYRCPVEQGEQLFVALKKLGVETEFIRYPGESHGLSRDGKPWHRIHRLEHILRWFKGHLEPEGGN